MSVATPTDERADERASELAAEARETIEAAAENAAAELPSAPSLDGTSEGRAPNPLILIAIAFVLGVAIAKILARLAE